jgi:hypothetical protein
MKALFAGLLLAISVPAVAQTAPFKLVISWHRSNLTVIDYPSLARCEQARKAVEAEVARRTREMMAALPPGGQIIGGTANGAFCIPG